MLEGIEISTSVIFLKTVIGRKERFILDIISMASITTLFIILVVSTQFSLEFSYEMVLHSYFYSAISLSAAWLTIFITAISFLTLIALQITPTKEGQIETMIFTELGASRQTLFTLYLLKALLRGFFAGPLGFFTTYVTFSIIGLSWKPSLSLLVISIILVALATLVSNLYFLKTSQSG